VSDGVRFLRRGVLPGDPLRASFGSFNRPPPPPPSFSPTVRARRPLCSRFGKHLHFSQCFFFFAADEERFVVEPKQNETRAPFPRPSSPKGLKRDRVPSAFRNIYFFHAVFVLGVIVVVVVVVVVVCAMLYR